MNILQIEIYLLKREHRAIKQRNEQWPEKRYSRYTLIIKC